MACAGIALGVDAHIDAEGSIKPLEGGFSLKIGAKLELTGEAYVGAGVCDSNCETPCVDVGLTEICSPIPCFKKELKDNIIVGLNGEVNNSGFNLSFSKQ